MFKIKLKNGCIIVSSQTKRKTIRSPKWCLFVALLVHRANSQGGYIDIEYLLRFSEFRFGRGGKKSEKTVCGEIGNFIRLLEKDSFKILTYQKRDLGGWKLNLQNCSIVSVENFEQLLEKSKQTLQEEVFDISESDERFSKWALLVSNAKLKFLNGKMSSSLNQYEKALVEAKSDLLKVATYAEIARVVYRADRDKAEDYREEAKDFALDAKLHPVLRAIYVPRIEGSFIFQRDSRDTAEERSSKVDAISQSYLHGVDISGLCRAFNLAFITYQAAGDEKTLNGKSKAIITTRAAIILSIAVGDPDLIQASIYNYALALRIFGDYNATLDIQIELLEYNYEFCKALNIGEDTAQGSLSLASLLLKKEEVSRSLQVLRRASKILHKSKNRLDIALYFSCKAELILTMPNIDKKISAQIAIRRFQMSKELYISVGREDAVEGIENKIFICSFMSQ